MKTKRTKSRTLRTLWTTALYLTLTGALALSGCSGGKLGKTGDLMAGITPSGQAKKADLNGPEAEAVTEFGLELLKRCSQAEPEDSLLVSPLSVLSALAMTAGGAQGNTLDQFDRAFGLPAHPLREYLSAYMADLSSDSPLHQANSLWLKTDALEVNPDFLQQNADYLQAGVYQEPFDQATLEKINAWVKEHTHGMIPQMLDQLPPGAVMVLVNALAFEAQWREVYKENQVRAGAFTTEDGTALERDFMFSSESGYMRDQQAQGFLKYYLGGRYAFAALLPEEGVTLSEYLESLTGQHLRELLTQANGPVDAGIPRFEQAYSASLADICKAMGMTDAFDPSAADFSLMGKAADNEPLYIDQVQHKAFISVYEQGTQAGAATAVAMATGALVMPDELPQVILNRPFLYMIVDMEAKLPLFIGTLYQP